MQPNTQLIMGNTEQGTASNLTQNCVSHVDHMHVHVLLLCTHSSTHTLCAIYRQTGQVLRISAETFLLDVHMPNLILSLLY